MTDRELMKMALDAIEQFCEYQAMLRPMEIRDALRERLHGKWEPQIEQLYTPKGDLISISIKRTPDGPREQIHPKREWVWLTDVEIADIEDEELTLINTETFSFARAIEAKLKEKNGG